MRPSGHSTPDISQFISSGKFLKEHQTGGGTGRFKLDMARSVPVASERFHDALDELENEVRVAQTVLRRDLALLKQDRKKREAAAKQHEAEKARLAAESRNAPPKKEEPPVKEETSTPALPEAPIDSPQPEQTEEADTALKGEEDPVVPPIETNLESLRDPLFDGTPTTANAQESEFDFEAMFGDAMDTSGDTNNDDMMDTSGDMNFGLDDGSSLLPGLEDFAKSGGEDNTQGNSIDLDFAMPDLPDLSTITAPAATSAPAPTISTPATAPPAPAQPEQPPVQPAAAEPQPPDETNNEDDMMATMATNDLDDLFNLDEYENPENSSFDDAFFNFDN